MLQVNFCAFQIWRLHTVVKARYNDILKDNAIKQQSEAAYEANRKLRRGTKVKNLAFCQCGVKCDK